jgi:hypothetical protein
MVSRGHYAVTFQLPKPYTAQFRETFLTINIGLIVGLFNNCIFCMFILYRTKLGTKTVTTINLSESRRLRGRERTIPAVVFKIKDTFFVIVTTST